MVRRSNMNRRSGMSRSNFLRNAGLGAAGLAGAAMMGSSVYAAKPTPPPSTYKIGILSAITGWPNGGEAAKLVCDFALDRAESDLGVKFERYYADCTCGDNAIPGFLYLKNQGVDFIVGPSCSGSAATLFSAPVSASSVDMPYPEQHVPSFWSMFVKDWASSNALDAFIGYWDSTSMLSFSADNFAINELMNQNMRAVVDPNGPLRYRTFGVSALEKTKPLGEYIGQQGYATVALVTQDEPYVKGLADGVKLGLSSYGITPIEYLSDNTVDAYKAAIQSAAGADAVVFNVFTTDYAYMVEQALEGLYCTKDAQGNIISCNVPFDMYGGPGFTFLSGHSPAATGMVAETAVADLDQQAWNAYRLPKRMEARFIELFEEGPEQGLIYCVQHVEAVRVMTNLMVKHNGNVSLVNDELEHEYFDTFFGTFQWGGSAFPQGLSVVTTFYEVDSSGNASAF